MYIDSLSVPFEVDDDDDDDKADAVLTEEEIAYRMRRSKKVGDTPLHFAVRHGDCAAELVHYMLSKKARAADVTQAKSEVVAGPPFQRIKCNSNSKSFTAQYINWRLILDTESVL